MLWHWYCSVHAASQLVEAAGVFDETVFKGMDKVLDSAAKHDLKVITSQEHPHL